MSVSQLARAFQVCDGGSRSRTSRSSPRCSSLISCWLNCRHGPSWEKCISYLDAVLPFGWKGLSALHCSDMASWGSWDQAAWNGQGRGWDDSAAQDGGQDAQDAQDSGAPPKTTTTGSPAKVPPPVACRNGSDMASWGSWDQAAWNGQARGWDDSAAQDGGQADAQDAQDSGAPPSGLPKATTTGPPAKVPPPPAPRASGDVSGASKDGGPCTTVAIPLEERVRMLEQRVAELELLLAEALRDRLANPSQDVQDVVLKPAEDGIDFVRSCTLEGRCFHCGRSRADWARTRIPLCQHVWQSHQSETLGSDWQDVAKFQCMTRKVCGVPNASGSGVISCLCPGSLAGSLGLRKPSISSTRTFRWSGWTCTPRPKLPLQFLESL